MKMICDVPDEVIKSIKDGTYCGSWMAEKMIAKGIPLEQEPCTDAISREELLKAIDTWDKFGYTETGCFVREPKGDYVPYIHYDDVIKSIKGMPPVTPQYTDAEIQKMQELEQAEIQKAYEIGKAEGSEVLDKIRAEIVHLHDWAFSREEILRIIDKYKTSRTEAEGSDKE